MTKIRNMLANVRAPKPKGRKAVVVNSQAAANAVKRRWELEDAVRDTSARVFTIADHADAMVSDAIRETAAEAVAKGVNDGITAAERKAAREAALRHERDRKKEARKDACREAHEARVKAADKQRDIAQRFNYEDYLVRHRDWKRNEDLSDPTAWLFPTLAPHDLPESKWVEYCGSIFDALAPVAKAKDVSLHKLIDLVSDRIGAEYSEQNDRANAAYNDAVAESEELLERQLAAIDRGETPPQPDADYEMLYHDDGSVTIQGRRLKDDAAIAEFFREKSKATAFDDETVTMYGLQVPVTDIYAHKAEQWS